VPPRWSMARSIDLTGWLTLLADGLSTEFGVAAATPTAMQVSTHFSKPPSCSASPDANDVRPRCSAVGQTLHDVGGFQQRPALGGREVLFDGCFEPRFPYGRDGRDELAPSGCGRHECLSAVCGV
jgi:hypothetical protein